MEELEITQDMQDDYGNNPNLCPFCKSDNISGGHIDAANTYATRNVICLDCKAEWTEMFELIEISNAFRNNGD